MIVLLSPVLNHPPETIMKVKNYVTIFSITISVPILDRLNLALSLIPCH